jgi:uncharacterized membrane protein
MQASKDDQKALRQAIEEWLAEGIITKEQADKMKASAGMRPSQRQQLAQYFFIIAVSSALLAFGALFLDEKILERLRQSFLLSNYTIAIGSAVLAAVAYWYARRRHHFISDTSYEVYLSAGGLCTLVALTYLCKEIGAGRGYTLFTGLCTIVFCLLSAAFRSRVLWVWSLLALMGWFGAFSTVHSHNNLFLGMNYPVRFSLFGALIIALSTLQTKTKQLAPFCYLTYHIGILICFTGLWGVSVFGNFASLDNWQAVRQTRMLPYAVATGLILAGTLYAGIRRNDAALRDYSILFLLLHLYTRYFEYFWDAMNKGLFFLFLAVSFGLLARWLSKTRINPAQENQSVQKI